MHIGVDVSKEKLDIYVPAKKEGSRPLTKEVDNNINGFRELRNLARKAKATVCVEPTGGYELELIAFMHKFDVPVAYTDALRVRQFARAEGSLSKNDAIDAALISRFADKIGVRVLEAQEVEAVELKRKAKFRQTMVDSRTAMINRLETEIDPEMKALLKEQIRLADRIIDKAERLCLDTVKKNDRMNSLKERFTAIGGVGDLTAISILSSLPEIGTLPDGKLNRLVGIAPEEKQSGTKETNLGRAKGRAQRALHGCRRIDQVERNPRRLLPQEAGGGPSAQVGDSPDHAQAAVAAEQDREGSRLHSDAGARVDETECQCRTKKESCVAPVPGRWFPFPSSFSPAPPHPPCYLFPALTRKDGKPRL